MNVSGARTQTADLLPAAARLCLGLRPRAFSQDGSLQMRMADARSVLRPGHWATKDTPVQGDESAGTRGAADTRTNNRFLMSLLAMPASAGASAVVGGVGRAHQEGLSLLVHGPFSFAPVRPVHQPVRPWDFSICSPEAPVEQAFLPLLGRIDAPAVVPPDLFKTIRTYRAAVRLCWALRRAKGLRPIDLGRDFGFTRQHVTDYLHDDDAPTRRSLPAERIAEFEDICGNTAITQWLAQRAQLTVLEEMQAARRAA